MEMTKNDIIHSIDAAQQWSLTSPAARSNDSEKFENIRQNVEWEWKKNASLRNVVVFLSSIFCEEMLFIHFFFNGDCVSFKTQ